MIIIGYRVMLMSTSRFAPLKLLTLAILLSVASAKADSSQKGDVVLKQQASNQSPEWDDDDYHQYIWKTPDGTKSPLGWIALTNGSKKDKEIDVELDNAWINKGGTYAHPSDEGAHKIGPLFAGRIKPGQTRLYEVAAGPHEIAAGNMDFQLSPSLKLEVKAGETVKLVCGRSFDGVADRYYSALYLFRRPKPGKYFYFLNSLDD
jgi:hypothetical protein